MPRYTTTPRREAYTLIFNLTPSHNTEWRMKFSFFLASPSFTLRLGNIRDPRVTLIKIEQDLTRAKYTHMSPHGFKFNSKCSDAEIWKCDIFRGQICRSRKSDIWERTIHCLLGDAAISIPGVTWSARFQGETERQASAREVMKILPAVSFTQRGG